MATQKIGYFVGSLATGSINRTLAKALIKLAPADLEFTEIQAPWRKPTGIIGASPGSIGTAVMQSSMRSVLSFLDAPPIERPGPHR